MLTPSRPEFVQYWFKLGLSSISFESEECVDIHDPSNATARRLSHDEWREIVQRMIQYGAAVTEPESETIVDYLTKSYGADPAPTAPSSHSSG